MKKPKNRYKVKNPEKYFYLKNGRVIKSLEELPYAIRVINQSEFSEHVNEKKNDFANWVKHVFGKEALAKSLNNKTSKEEFTREIDNYLNKDRTHSFSSAIIATAIIFMILIAGLFVLKPTITGFVVQEELTKYTNELNLQINESGAFQLDMPVQGELTSFTITGQLIGNGTASVYFEDKLVYNSKKNLINSITGLIAGNEKQVKLKNKTKQKQDNNTNQSINNSNNSEEQPKETQKQETDEVITTEFSDICQETCSLNINKTSYTISYNIENVKLLIKNISYTLRTKEEVDNEPPLFVLTDELVAKGEQTYDLNQFFDDPDKDSLVFVTLDTENLTLDVNNNILTVSPDQGFEGKREITVFASDSYSTVKDKIQIVVVNESFQVGEIVVEIPKEEPKEQQQENTTQKQNTTVEANQTIEQNTTEIIFQNETVNLTTQTNLTDINLTLLNASELNITDQDLEEELANLTQMQAEVGKPVKWVKEVSAINLGPSPKPVIFSLDIPLESTNIVIKEKRSGNTVSKELKVKEIKDKKEKKAKRISFQHTLEPEYIAEFEIEFETESPKLEEKQAVTDIRYTKEIVIKSNASVHYKNVMAFTDIAEAPQNMIKLYHVVNGTRTEVQIDVYNDTNENGRIDRIHWTVPMLSEQSYEVSIDILNLQSNPQVGSYWTTNFVTVGQADLTINGSSGTIYGTDLEFVELKCGDTVVNTNYDGNKVQVSNYQCDETSHHKVRVITSGKHTQKFMFGGAVGYANNFASELPSTLNIQGKLTNSTGGLVNASADFVFRIYNVSSGGTALWTEAQTLTVDTGIYDAILGSVTAITLEFDVPYYLGVEVNSDGEMSPRLNLTSAPYARRAHKAEMALLVENNVVGSDQLNDTECSDGEVYKKSGGTWVCALDSGLGTESDTLETVANRSSVTTHGLTIDSDGNNLTNISSTFYVDGNQSKVGILTASPSSEFQVIGTGNFSTDVIVAGQSVCQEDGTNCPAGAGSVSPWTNDSSNIYPLYSNLNVSMDNNLFFMHPVLNRIGLNTYFPTVLLDINGSMNVTSLTGMVSTPTLCLNGSCRATWPSGTITGSGAIDTITFWTGTTSISSNTNLTWNNSLSRLGIKTTSPSHELAVVGTANITGDVIVAGQSVCQEDGTNCPAGATSVSPWINDSSDIYPSSSLNITVDTNLMFIHPGIDRIGIGTMYPSTKLDVNGSINISDASASMYTPELCLNGSCRGDWPAGTITGSGAINTITFWTSATTISSNTNLTWNNTISRLGIKTMSPSHELAIVGTANVTGDVIVAGQSVCQEDGTNCPEGATSVSPWTNDSSDIYPSSSLNITVDTNLMFIHPGIDRIGIGTVNPATKLDVFGDINVSSAISGVYTPQLCLNGSCRSTWPAGTITGAGAADAVTFWTSDSSISSDYNLTWNNTQKRLGIGTSSPAAPVHITGMASGYDASPSLIIDTLSNTVADLLYNAQNVQKWIISMRDAAADNDLRFYRYNGSWQPVLVLNRTKGYVGIGTITPKALMDIGGGVANFIDGANDLLVRNDVEIDGNLYVGGNISGSLGATDIQDIWVNESGDTMNGSLTFNNVAKDIETPASQNFVIFPGANVGIGTTGPSVKLDVNGSINVSDSTGSLHTTQVCLNGSCRGDWPAGTITGSGLANRTAFWLSATELSYDGNFTWDTTAKRLGIGTDSPSHELSVIGTANVSTDVIVAGQSVCQEDGTNCPEGATSVSPWTNDSSNIYPVGDHNVTVDTNLLFVHPGIDRIGINTIYPTTELEINGSLNVTGSTSSVFATQLCLNGTCRGDWPAGTITGSGSIDTVTFWTSETSIGSDSNFIWNNTDKRLGIGMGSPSHELAVLGSANVTSDVIVGRNLSVNGTGTFNEEVKVAGQSVCRADGTNCPAGATSVSPWVNDSSDIYPTSIWNVTINNTLFFANQVLYRIGIGTAGPNALFDIGGGVVSFIDGVDDLLVKGDAEIDGSLWAENNISANIVSGNTIIGNISAGYVEDIWVNTSGDNMTGSLQFTKVTEDIKTNASEHLALMPGGNVGIKTTNPSHDFTVLGDANISSDLIVGGVGNFTTDVQVAGESVCQEDGTNCPAGATSVSPWVNDSSDIYPTSIWNVTINNTLFFANQVLYRIGIGTAGPNALFDIGGGVVSFIDGVDDLLVKGDAEIDGSLWAENNISANIVSGNTIIGNISAGYVEDIWVNTSGDNMTGSLQFTKVTEDIKTNASEHLALMPGGNVGIKTTDPSHDLTVLGDSNVSSNLYVGGDAIVEGVGNFTTDVQVSGQSVCQEDGTNCPEGATSVSPWTNDSSKIYPSSSLNVTVDTNLLFIHPAIDRIGINTIYPTTKLDVNGSINISDASASMYTPQLCLNGTCRGDWPQGTLTGAGAADTITFWTGESTVSYDYNLTWNNTQKRLGIGTSEPSHELAVVGSANITSDIVVGENLTVSNTGTFTQDVIIAGQSACREDGTNCPEGASSVSPWINDTTKVYPRDIWNITINNTLFFANQFLDRIGIGTAGPNALFDVGGATLSYVDGVDDLIVKDDVELNGALYVGGANESVIGSGGLSLEGNLTMNDQNIFDAGTVQANILTDPDDAVLTVDDDLALTSGDQITFPSEDTDKIYWSGTDYGTGIEANTLTSWAVAQFRWRIGGTTAGTGNETMTLDSAGDLSVDGALSVGDTTPDGNNYHTFGTGDADEVEINGTSDVYISGDLEIDGIFYGLIEASNVVDIWVNETGDTMSGNLNMSDTNITDINIIIVDTITDKDSSITIDDDLALTSQDQISFVSEVADKILWSGNTYGTGVEANTLTSWSANQFRWRTGGTNVSTGTEIMKVDRGGNLSIDGLLSVGDTSPDGNEYHTFGVGDADESGINSTDDVYVSGNLEIDGTFYGTVGAGNVEDIWVNASGDTMTGNLTMADSHIFDANIIEANTLRDPEDEAITIADNLSMGSTNSIVFASENGNKIFWSGTGYGTGVEASALTMWSSSIFRWRAGGGTASSGTETMLLESDGALSIDGPLSAGDSSPDSNDYHTFGVGDADESGINSTDDVYVSGDLEVDGNFYGVIDSGSVVDIWVNASGDTMTGDLNMSNNQINNASVVETDILLVSRIEDSDSSVTMNDTLLFTTDNQLEFASQNADKIYYNSNTFGLGTEADALTTWAANGFRWRFGGTSASSGTEIMTLDRSGNFSIDGAISVGDSSPDSHAWHVFGSGEKEEIGITGLNDVYISGNLEVDGNIFGSVDNGSVSDIWVNESGDTMTGNLTMGDNSILDANVIQTNIIEDSEDGAVTINDNLTLASGGRINFATEIGDKIWWNGNIYGAGLEADTITLWSANRFRWRVGGTNVSTGTETMVLQNTGALSIDGVLSAGDTTPDGNAYHTFGTGDADEVAIVDGEDVFISGDLEIDGTLYGSIPPGSIQDIWVNESGDTMTGNLTMSDTNIFDVNTLQTNTIEDGEDGFLTIDDNITLTSGDRINYANEVGDKVYWSGSTYGTGIETDTLSSWSAIHF